MGIAHSSPIQQQGADLYILPYLVSVPFWLVSDTDRGFHNLRLGASWPPHTSRGTISTSYQTLCLNQSSVANLNRLFRLLWEIERRSQKLGWVNCVHVYLKGKLWYQSKQTCMQTRMVYIKYFQKYGGGPKSRGPRPHIKGHSTRGWK